METIERSDLERMRDWAHEQVAASPEPAWAWYQHMKLRETLDAILSGMDRRIAVKHLAESEEPGKGLVLLAEAAQSLPPQRGERSALLGR